MDIDFNKKIEERTNFILSKIREAPQMQIIHSSEQITELFRTLISLSFKDGLVQGIRISKETNEIMLKELTNN